MSKKVSDEIKRYVFELNSQGLKASEIAKIVGLNRTTILNYVRPATRGVAKFVTIEQIEEMKIKLNYFFKLISKLSIGDYISFKSRGYSENDRKYSNVITGYIFTKYNDKIFIESGNIRYCITINDLMGRNVVIVKVGDDND